MVFATVVLTSPFLADAHFALVGPKPWWRPTQGDQWFMNWTFSTDPPKLKLKPGEPTSSSPRGLGQFASDHNGEVDDWSLFKRMPWISPGTARVDSPCGIKGGNKNGCWGPCDPEQNSYYISTRWNAPCPSGIPPGPVPGTSTVKTQCADDEALDSLSLKAHKDYFMGAPITYWKAGQTAETSHRINANHGGGYSFRLCEVDSFDPADLIEVTEDCFQNTTLNFFGETQWLHCSGDAARTPLKAVLVTGTDVHPVNSQWRRSPIPVCKDPYEEWKTTCSAPAFDPPIPGLYGFVSGFRGGADKTRHVNECLIIDKVQVPQKPGKYVLSFRHDNEFHPQIWQGCSNIQILAPDELDPTPTPCICPAGKILQGKEEVRTNKGKLQSCEKMNDVFTRQGRCDWVRKQSKYRICCVDPPVEPEAEPEHEGEGSEPESEGEPEQSEQEHEGEGSEHESKGEQEMIQKLSTKLSRQMTMSVDDHGSVEQM